MNHDTTGASCEQSKAPFLIGMLIALFIIPTEYNLFGNNWIAYVSGTVVFPLAAIFSIWISRSLFLERAPLLFQFTKYGLVGLSDTVISFGVLNAFASLTGITKGHWLILFIAVGFICSMINSYTWNSCWSFDENKCERSTAQFVKYFTVILFGIILNSCIVLYFTKIVPWYGFSSKQWLNVVSFSATLIAGTWNFLACKQLVFKKGISP